MTTLVDGRRLEYVAGRSRKFWEWRLYEGYASTAQYELKFTWGRLGTTGKSTSEFLGDRSLALWKARKRENEKLDKGYRPALNSNIATALVARETQAMAARFVKPVPAEREIRREVARKPVAAPALPPVVPLVAERRIKLK